ncbi:hypothetical protein GON01_04155 [Sphingomonas sp. MAH-20]|uniref:Type II toxin-antitoxin system RelE/ParE family toxin n=1 Tax=Sphingomonas horti TaxID=2682842 RepID=A0A6I4J0H7_9SPHN|nr:type II toxin-antitoxin system RelE/ParE family toxin [Sphingomonas sp. CGMCC 1.13658]MVO77131.1 hypothetical protein [Sphingomonas horti]
MRAELSAAALRDLEAIERYWVPRDPDLYRDLTRALENTFEFLLDRPSAGSIVEKSSVRKWRIGRTPFLLFYRTKPDLLFVTRIRHQHQNWRRHN